ncbi:serine threonine kinase 11 interacting protein [Nesidiocoris tenuis]|uniref:Serine threonine kinase 11 interacting protein n=1 Tax=Nesidiocoris tenuis TaxID=355587 RepID=A0ABN7B0R9_9HEMI|nr:serine threonine kinase 11 interacting protein [Nesidiocoris tenuis]
MANSAVDKIFDIVDKSLNPQITHALINGQIDLCIRSNLLRDFWSVVLHQDEEKIGVILSHAQRLKIEHFLKLLHRIPTVCIDQRVNDSFEASVDLDVFKNLKTLRLSHVAISKLKIGSHLKSQLVSFVASHCSEVDSMFSDKLHWAELSSISLLNCKFRECPDSMKNAPWLRTLSLTYCKLKSCEFLLSLDHLEHLNIGYNFLSNIPSLNDNARTRLKTLRMNNNCVVNMSGIERMTSLRGLDLMYNWLPSKNSLVPLASLRQLISVKLKGNPVSHIKFYRIYVASCINFSDPKMVTIDELKLNKVELAICGRNLLGGEDQNPADESTTVDVDRPSTSTATVTEVPPMASSFISSTPGRPKLIGKPAVAREPVILDDCFPVVGLLHPPVPSVVNTSYDSVSPSIMGQHSKSLIDESAALEEAISRLPAPSSTADQSVEESGGGALATSEPLDDESDRKLPSRSISPIQKTGSPVAELKPETVLALVHAAEFESNQTESNEDTGQRNLNITGGGSFHTAKGNSTLDSYATVNDETFGSSNCQDESNASEYQDADPNDTSVAEASLTDEPTAGASEGLAKWNNCSDSGMCSDPNQLCQDLKNSDVDVASNAVQEKGRVENEDIDESNQRSDSSNSNNRENNSDESCYESDSDADEPLWHVMKLDPHTMKGQAVFLALLENDLKERSPKSGATITKWPLDSVLSCVKTKNDPITIEIKFDSARKDKQHRCYVMEFADAQALTKKMYNILECRPLKAMNHVTMKCLKCSSMFALARPNNINKESSEKCPICGSTVVAETEEPKPPEKTSRANKTVSHSPSLSSIGSSTEQSQKCDVPNSHRRYESDVEVISNPSLSSIEVIDESRSQSITPMRKMSEERQTVPELNLREALSPLTESGSSGSLTESVITAYESHSVVINRKSFSTECLPEESYDNSNNTTLKEMKGSADVENGNVAINKRQGVYSFTNFKDVDQRILDFVRMNLFKNEQEELLALVRCHIWKTGGSDYDGCFILSSLSVYFLYHNYTDFSTEVCDWLSPNEFFPIADVKRLQPIVWHQGLEIQIRNFSFILLLMDQERTLSFVQHVSGLSIKGMKIVPQPNAKIVNALQQAVLTSELSYKLDQPAVTLTALCRSIELTQVDVSDEIFRLASLVITRGVFFIVPGDLSWLCSAVQPTFVACRGVADLIGVEKSGLTLVLHFFDETEAVVERWSAKLTTESQLTSIVDGLRQFWEQHFSLPLEVTVL